MRSCELVALLDGAHFSVAIIFKRAVQLFFRVHHERTISCDGLVQRLAGKDQYVAGGIAWIRNQHLVAIVRESRYTAFGCALRLRC